MDISWHINENQDLHNWPNLKIWDILIHKFSNEDQHSNRYLLDSEEHKDTLSYLQNMDINIQLHICLLHYHQMLMKTISNHQYKFLLFDPKQMCHQGMFLHKI